MVAMNLVPRGDPEPSLPSQDESTLALRQDAAAPRGDETSCWLFSTPWRPATTKSGTSSSTCGTTHARTMPPTSSKGKASSRPSKGCGDATHCRPRRHGGGQPTQRSRAYKNRCVPQKTEFSTRKSEASNQPGPVDVDATSVRSAAQSIQQAVNNIAAGLQSPGNVS